MKKTKKTYRKVLHKVTWKENTITYYPSWTKYVEEEIQGFQLQSSRKYENEEMNDKIQKRRCNTQSLL